MMAPLVDLSGKRGLVVGIANEHSIAAGCAQAFRDCGARLAATYLNERQSLSSSRLRMRWASNGWRRATRVPGELEALFARVAAEWGGLDFLLHSIAFAPKEDLHGRVIDSSAEGFGVAMDVSCHSFLRMARLAEPLMPQGGCLLCVTFYGSERVVRHYNLMGPVKAALTPRAMSRPNWGRRAFARTPSRRGRSRRAPPAGSTGSTNCSTAPRPKCLKASLST
jgi:enoyl-[acyl-carrier protein] reductase I